MAVRESVTFSLRVAAPGRREEKPEGGNQQGPTKPKENCTTGVTAVVTLTQPDNSMTPTDIDPRLAALEERVDRDAHTARDERLRVDTLVRDVAEIRGAVTEMRWTLRILLALGVVLGGFVAGLYGDVADLASTLARVEAAVQ